MRVTEELRNEHGTLRAKLALLERLLPRARATQTSLRDVTASLGRCLCRHTEKETFLVELLQERLPEDTRDTTRHLLEEHDEHSHALTALRECFAQEGEGEAEQVAAQAVQLIEELREHMAVEEELLFPEVDRALGATQAKDAVRLMHTIVRCSAAEEPREAQGAYQTA